MTHHFVDRCPILLLYNLFCLPFAAMPMILYLSDICSLKLYDNLLYEFKESDINNVSRYIKKLCDQKRAANSHI